mgnify:CR=1 FL=1
MINPKSWNENKRTEELPPIYATASELKREVAELRAALAKSQPVERGAPVAWVRCHPDGTLTDELMPNSIIEVVRKYSGAWVPLFARPVCPMSDEPVLGTKTWLEGGVVMTQNLTASDIYKPAPMSDDDFISAIEASGIEVENVDAAFAIKRIVELFHDIKGATE